MTEPVLGSSLPQARNSHSSHHNYHNHIHSHHNHERLHKRQDESSETVVQVVQTVSVIQIIDSSGATVSTTTQTSEPTTIPYSGSAEASFGIESEPDVTTSSDDTTTTTDVATSSGVTTSLVAAVTDDVSDTATSSVSSETASSVDTATSSSTSSMTSSFPTVESFAPITTALSSDSSTTGFPTFAGVTNSTTATDSTTTAADSTATAITSSLFFNGTASINAFTANLTTSTLPHSSGTILYNDTYTTTIGVSSSFTSSFASFTGTATSTGTEDNGSVTGFGFGGSTGGSDSGSGGTATGGAYSPSSTSTDVSGSESGSKSSSTSAGTVAGSVLGAVAGIGLILIAALMLLRYKKRQRGLRLSDSNGLPGTRGLVLGGGEGPSGGNGGTNEMSEGRSVPFMVPAALANLTGYKRSSQRTASSEGTERGFQKVSGRKLPSVLQHGGDGYSDPTSAANPRDTMMTDQSFYRDSQGYYTGPDIPRLAVGSPMRPESGVPVFHPGPGRTPVTASSYFASNLEPPRRDPLGRSLASQDGSRISRGSGSRFTEEI